MGKKRGHPTDYQPDHCEQVERLCKLGLTDTELADFFEVHVDTFYEWKKVHPDFSEAIKNGKERADAKVAEKLFRRAMGYSHEAEKVFCDVKTGTEQIVKYTEHYPPDTVACIFWLKNRQRRIWRDRHDLEHTGKDGASIEPINSIELARRVAFLLSLPEVTENATTH